MALSEALTTEAGTLIARINHLLTKMTSSRQLASYAKDLYELGDFTSEDPKRDVLSSKIEGFIDAGTLIEVVTPAEVQK